LREDEGAGQDVLGRDPVRQVEELHVGRNPLDHAVAGADELVLEAEVAQERDEASHRSASLTASTSPSRSCVGASATTRRPRLVATRVVCGPIDAAGTSTPSVANERAAEPEARSTRSPSGMCCGRTRVVS